MKYSPGLFDFIVGVLLVIGLIRGRRRGMSEELLILFQWIAIVVVAGMFYPQLSATLAAFVHFSPLYANVWAYVLLALGVKILFLLVKKVAGEKLTGSDMFGPLEYYLGMISGMIRWFCMLMVGLSLFGARLYSEAELVAQVKQDKDVYGSSFFPRHGAMQQEVFKNSFTGPLVVKNLGFLLIKPEMPQDIKSARDSFQEKAGRDVNDAMRRR